MQAKTKTKVFGRRSTLQELEAKCRERGWTLNTEKFDDGTSDYVSFRFQVEKVSGLALVSTINGRVMGVLDGGEHFNSDYKKHDKKPWFQVLLGIALVEQAA